MAVVFVAIDIPENIEEQLLLRRRNIAGARWKKQFHLAINYVGEIDDLRVDAVNNALKRIDRVGFKLLLSGCGVRRRGGVPRSLWFGLEDASEIEPLRAAIGAQLDDAGVTWERERFAPHVTIAHLSRKAPVEQIDEWVEEHEGWHSYSFEVRSLQVHASGEVAGEHAHWIEATIPLRAPVG